MAQGGGTRGVGFVGRAGRGGDGFRVVVFQGQGGHGLQVGGEPWKGVCVTDEEVGWGRGGRG